ncbi:MAG: hypothetical protein V1492_03985 [Candidatus Micrarchaeota archaeon]
MKLAFAMILALVLLFGCINPPTPPVGNETPAGNGTCVGCYQENTTVQPQNNTVPPVSENVTLPNNTINQTIPVGNNTIVNESKPNVTTQKCVGPEIYNISEQKQVIYQGQTFKDTCALYNVVTKYFCKNDTVKSENVDCAPGDWCQFGACLKFEGVCIDSDGNDTGVRGSVSYAPAPLVMDKHEDECIDEGTIKEWLCDGSQPYYEEMPCGTTKKCLDGRCIRSKCNETDGGDVPALFGRVTFTGKDEYYEDTCISIDVLKEYYCFGDTVKSKTYKCAHSCDYNQCIPKEEIQ